VRPSAVVAALKRAGFVEKRQKGSHVILWSEKRRSTTIVALHSRDIAKPTLRDILKRAGLTDEDFRKLL
jgi:predicted RNA binding protein YcfA (HicA-like mRNA interferase family)